MVLEGSFTVLLIFFGHFKYVFRLYYKKNRLIRVLNLFTFAQTQISWIVEIIYFLLILILLEAAGDDSLSHLKLCGSRIQSRGHLGTLTLGPEEVSWLLCTPVKLYSLGWGHLGTSTLGSFTKPPLLQESRLTGGGSPNLVDLVERKVSVERRMGASNSSHSF